MLEEPGHREPVISPAVRRGPEAKGTDYPFVSPVGQDGIRSSGSLGTMQVASCGGDAVVPLVWTLVPFVTAVDYVPRYDELAQRWFADMLPAVTVSVQWADPRPADEVLRWQTPPMPPMTTETDPGPSTGRP